MFCGRGTHRNAKLSTWTGCRATDDQLASVAGDGWRVSDLSAGDDGTSPLTAPAPHHTCTNVRTHRNYVWGLHTEDFE